MPNRHPECFICGKLYAARGKRLDEVSVVLEQFLTFACLCGTTQHPMLLAHPHHVPDCTGWNWTLPMEEHVDA